MDTNEFAKFLTNKLMSRIDEPVSERKSRREEQKSARKPFLERWLGVIPFGVSVWYDEKRDKFGRNEK